MSDEYKTKAKSKATAAGLPVFCAHDKIVPARELKPNPRNPNQHPPEQIKLLAEIIKAQGWRAPVTVSTRSGLIVRGHGRLEAALLLEAGEVPVDYQNYASDAEEWADLVADNRIVEFAEFDPKLLTELLRDVDASETPFILTGYTEDEYNDLVMGMAESDVMVNISDDIVPEPPKIPYTELGDVWYLGDHILICGDSTKRETYNTLLGKDKAQLIITDPPYNVNYEGAAGKILNDKQKNTSFRRFLFDAFACMREASEPGTAAYIFHADTEGVNFRTAFVAAGFSLKQCLIWVKNVFVLGRQDYHWWHEPILYGWIEGKPHYFIADRTQDTVIEDEPVEPEKMKKDELLTYIKQRSQINEFNSILYEDKPNRNDVHPTMKPVRLVARLINNSSKPRAIVLDPFGGSGSTLMACEHLNRAARVIELDPRFCDVILMRYYRITGKTDIRCIRNGEPIAKETIDFILEGFNTEGGV